MIKIPSDQRTVTDEDVLSAFDVSLPGLLKVRKAWEKGQINLAKKELIRYFETRKYPTFYYDYRKKTRIPMEINENPYVFQSALGLQGDLKEFCLYAGKKLMDHIYVRPGRELELFLGEKYEHMPHFNFYEDQGKKHRTVTDIFVRGQIFEYLSILYHETGEEEILREFCKIYQAFFTTYPLSVDESCLLEGRFSMKEDRDIMSTGFLAFSMLSLLYTRIPYEIPEEDAFEIIKNLWFLGIQFRRFDKFPYQDYNHHLWEKGLVPYILSVMLPEIPAFAEMEKRSVEIINRHIKRDFNIHGGYDEHSISYWAGATLGEMLCRGIFLSEKNGKILLEEKCKSRLDASFSILAAIAPPGEKYPCVGDGEELYIDPILCNGIRGIGNNDCKQILEVRRGGKNKEIEKLQLDYCDDTCGFACFHGSYGKKENYFLMSVKKTCGSSGHNHMDMLSVNIFFHGEEIIGEPYAKAIYHKACMGSKERGYFYNMTSHNTVLAYGNPVVSDECFSNKWGVFRSDSPVDYFFSGQGGSFVQAHHDAYGFCRHVRRVLFYREKGILLEDEILRGNRLPYPHIQRWNFMPGVRCSQIGTNRILIEKNGIKVLFIWSGNPTFRFWKKESLYPDIVRDFSALGICLDVLFSFFEETVGDMASVCQKVLMVDVTEEEISDEKIEQWLEQNLSIRTKQEWMDALKQLEESER